MRGDYPKPDRGHLYICESIEDGHLAMANLSREHYRDWEHVPQRLVQPVQVLSTIYMPTIKLSYTEARANLAKIWDQVVQNREAAVLHRRGTEDVVLIPASEFEGLVETAHLLRSPKNAQRMMQALHRALENDGQASSIDQLATELRLEREA